MRLVLDMEKIEAKRVAEGITKRDMAEVAGSGRPTYYFDLLRNDGRTNKEDRAIRLVSWYGSTDCVFPWSLNRYLREGLIL